MSLACTVLVPQGIQVESIKSTGEEDGPTGNKPTGDEPTRPGRLTEFLSGTITFLHPLAAFCFKDKETHAIFIWGSCPMGKLHVCTRKEVEHTQKGCSDRMGDIQEGWYD